MTRAVIDKVRMIRIKEKRETLFRDVSLMLAMFFLPLGYDALFKFVMDITGSYWIADIVFYGISGLFWLSFIFYTKSLNKLKQ